jgi:hypothetical protein
MIALWVVCASANRENLFAQEFRIATDQLLIGRGCEYISMALWVEKHAATSKVVESQVGDGQKHVLTHYRGCPVTRCPHHKLID